MRCFFNSIKIDYRRNVLSICWYKKMILGNNVCLSVTTNINTTLNMVNIYELLLKEIFHCPLVVNHWRSQSFPWFIKHDLGTKITLIWTNKIYQTMQMLKILSTLGECIRGNVFVAQKYLTRKTFYLFVVLFSMKVIHQRILNRIL